MSSYNWLFFALVTVATWGLYGIFLHAGQMGMSDPVNGRYKAFFWVGIAYFLVAVLAPAGLMIAKGTDWSFPQRGLWLSLFAGILGAIGAFFVLLALGSGVKTGGTSMVGVVMSIIFAGAPIVNALVLVTKEKQWASVPIPFLLGIVLAAVGAFLVVRFKPDGHGGPPKKKVAIEAAIPEVEIQATPTDGSDIDRAA